MQHSPPDAPRSLASDAARLAGVAILVGLAAGGLFVLARRDGPAAIERSGSLPALVEAFTRGIPALGSGAYVSPTAGQAEQLGRAFAALERGDLSRAAREADPLGYEVVRLDDPARGRFLVLQERPSASPRRNWGLFVHRTDAASTVTVEVPHPRADVATELVGLALFLELSARDLLVAGAHRAAGRGEGDAAHDLRSPFAVVSRAALRPGAVVVQPHGFDERRASRSSYGDVVLSPGEPRRQALVERLARSLRRAGIGVCVYGPGRCTDLGATTNVEGRATRAAGGTFVHVEIALRVRRDAARRHALVTALVDGLRP